MVQFDVNVRYIGGSLTAFTASISAVWWQRKLEGQQANCLSTCYTTEQWEADRGSPNSRSLVRMQGAWSQVCVPSSEN